MKKNIFILSVLFFLCCCNNNSSSQSSNENTNEDIWMSGALFSLNEVPQVTDYFVLTDGYWTCSHIIETEDSVTEKKQTCKQFSFSYFNNHLYLTSNIVVREISKDKQGNIIQSTTVTTNTNGSVPFSIDDFKQCNAYAKKNLDNTLFYRKSLHYLTEDGINYFPDKTTIYYLKKESKAPY